MGIRRPAARLGEIEKQILVLISNLLIDHVENNTCVQSSNQQVILSDQEAQHLLMLLEKLLENKKFREGIFFTDDVGFGASDDASWKKLIFKNSGRSSVQANTKWINFLHRLGHDVPWNPKSKGERMSIDYFMKMENELLKELNVDERVRRVLIRSIAKISIDIERARVGEYRDVRIVSSVFSPLMKLLADKVARMGGVSVGERALEGVLIIITNSSVLFTTRDWDVAATISQMAGALVSIIERRKD